MNVVPPSICAPQPRPDPAPAQDGAAPAAVAAANAAAASFTALTSRLDYLDAASIEQVRQAYRFADEAHLGQLRDSGEPYITHPIAVAAQCTAWKLDAQALMAALLHDAMEDCDVTKANLIDRFGAPVAELVDGLTKLDHLPIITREENQAKSFRKMLLATARDVRVILIKLADRTHNMRTLSDTPRSKWARISMETLEIYAPIAHRLGLDQTYRELQDLAFRHLHPWRHATLDKAVSKLRNSRRRDLLQKVQTEVSAAFTKIGMKVSLTGREKTLYAIYQKMKLKHLGFLQVTDLYGFRIIVPTVTDCYTALGVLHQMYQPVPGRFKDYIAIAKPNGYQSLHTTLVGPSGVNIEFQMRTDAMHAIAESGVATHWLYKSQDTEGISAEHLDTHQWLQSLLDIQNETRGAAEFWEHVKVDLFPDTVYVLTPKSLIMALPRGATVVDFAYAIHSNVGDHTTAAKINNEQVPLRTELKNGDTVQVITDPASTPNPAWLSFVRTGQARSKIRHYLKTLAQTEPQGLGEKLLAQALRAEGLEQLPPVDATTQPLWDKLLRFTGNRTRNELLTDLVLGKRIASIVAKRLMILMTEHGHRPDALLLSRERYTSHETLSQGSVTLDGSETASIQYAPCCRPVPGDNVVGYLGHGEGLAVHTAHCGVAKRLQHKDSERFIAVDWSDEPTRMFETGVVVTVTNGKGVLARVAGQLANSEADITHVGMDDEVAMKTIDLRFSIAVHDRTHLETILHNLRHTPSVIRAARMTPKV
ncbi:bifunctional (p)ppGpp synthetase/guanosine-3',5'-bis(diphosphate) 3'-pyrophosphohydrolase [Verminephrobacter eiseniae]|nr:bifunctional (p)ppGpp synthetase/guanosine-3',5'-bis(diphosphate) 3'-pyrophosphohydrolase [Verminephrobacter eiseniae]MCW5285432.1 bifunctional (p)ppGpp synthetase/guanosine-3',5'-bis(diphosphate) 3'-pyrophosphohydrolase [Verminephrobacter eiseniae]MCW5303732.1 bifunctional (p)ppGpp synthetase/guanosine-3',5'-bis(diphosphate) 3'-pyrophosphohydrolase [Verminephrobacter eiseniae]MCW8181850.1 bifunctional (p)ppGpp synthetase/guanosine-3',5'-bis(diphosphate) 3'-pyrophosphohydrolase [Verminephroba